MRIRSHRELLDDAFWLNPSLREMSKHLFRDIFRRPVRGGNLNCVILALVVAHCPHVRSDLTILELNMTSALLGRFQVKVQCFELTCNTVTGNLAPN